MDQESCYYFVKRFANHTRDCLASDRKGRIFYLSPSTLAEEYTHVHITVLLPLNKNGPKQETQDPSHLISPPQ